MPNNGTQIARINPNDHYNRDNLTNNMIEYNNTNRPDNRNLANDTFNNFNRFNPDREFFRGYNRILDPDTIKMWCDIMVIITIILTGIIIHVQI